MPNKLWYLVVYNTEGQLLQRSRPSACPGSWIGKAHEVRRGLWEIGVRDPQMYIFSSEGDSRKIL